MGCGGRSTSGQEVDPRREIQTGSSFAYKRRTALRLWCGVVFFGAISACGASPPSAAATPGVLTIGFPEGRVTGTELGVGQLITAFTLEGLTQVNFGVDGRALPRLAESWAWEEDGLRLRLKLRNGVVFHDGTNFTSNVAAEALQRAIKRPANQALYPSLADIGDVRPEGELELSIDLVRPSALLPEELDLPLGLEPGGIGTGAFRLTRQDGDGVLLERFDQYYLGVPQIRQIVIKPFDTLRTTWTSLLRGEVDMVTDVPPDAIEFMPSTEVHAIPYARNYQFLVAFNSERQPFASRVVRRALNSAIDRSRLIDNVLQGQGQPAFGPIWPQHWAYDATVPPYSFDPSSVVTMLENAGFHMQAPEISRPPARLRFTCLLPSDFALLERIGLEVQKQLYDVGVDMQFEEVSIQEYDARIREGRFDAVLVDMISGPTLGRPFLFWRSGKRFKGLNVFGYENAEAERLFQVIRTSTNEAAIRSATSRLQRVFLEDPPALAIAWNHRARAVRRRFNVDASGRDPLFTIWQWTENTDSEPPSTQ